MMIADALRQATARLMQGGIDGAARDARILLAHVAGLPLERMTLHSRDLLLADQLAALDRAVSARLGRQPISQIIGYRLFWGRRFRVTGDVLDPRPETETLVAAALEEPFERVLDLGTGSGAILLTLLAERQDASGVGVDLSVPALGIAAETALGLGLAPRCTFLESDWFTSVTGTFDLIVSNPPYIADGEMPGLAPEVRDWEPHLALTPGGDGLGAYRILAAGATPYLRPGGRVLFETGAAQAGQVGMMLQAAGLHPIGVRKDMDGRDRVVVARRS
jgi:release factor glutamine methyltransferase